ncbi:MAG: hypothetical protein PWR13_725 [Archaeoglobi archaeon]|nr:hypothetical protein [Archaeoglobi archaeon]MDK2781697.1 hypothetical protein [Archaeoglobi archaeon]
MRIFCRELISGELLKDEKSEFYVVTPLGAVLKRAFITGILEERIKRENSWIFRIFDGLGAVRCVKENEPLLEEFREGKLIGVIGRPERYGNEIFLKAEEVFEIGETERKIWFIETSSNTLRRMRLRGRFGEDWIEFRKEILSVSSIILDEVIISAIRELAENEISFEEILRRFKVDEELLRRVLEEMLLDGEIYEPKPGIYRRIS